MKSIKETVAIKADRMRGEAMDLWEQCESEQDALTQITLWEKADDLWARAEISEGRVPGNLERHELLRYGICAI